jgi:two-component sensor histidine kinase
MPLAEGTQAMDKSGGSIMQMTQRTRDCEMQLAETRHRFANTLQIATSLFRMRLRDLEDGEARDQILWALDVVTTLSLLQKRSLSDGESLQFYLRDVASLWDRISSEHGVSVTLDVVEPVELPHAMATSLALIANELVTNCVEHAFPDGRRGEVRVSLRRPSTEEAELHVADNGQGLRWTDGEMADQTGFSIVRAFTARIGGSLDLENRAGEGVLARIRFPLPANEARRKSA